MILRRTLKYFNQINLYFYYIIQFFFFLIPFFAIINFQRFLEDGRLLNFLFFLLFSGVFFFFANSNFLLIFLSSNTFSLFNEPLDFFRSTTLEIFSNSVFFFLEVLVTPHCCLKFETIMSHMRRGCVLGIIG